MMMKSGDQIFYPMQGVGIIESIETHQFTEVPMEYYKVYFPLNRMNILIPQDKAAGKGMRPLATPEALDQSRAVFFGKPMKLPPDPAKRRLTIQAKIESGNLFETAAVIRDLVCMEQQQVRLTPYDRSSLQTVCKLLALELMFIEEVPLELAKQLIKEDIELRLSGDEQAFYRYKL